jgi:hypothetical protein
MNPIELLYANDVFASVNRILQRVLVEVAVFCLLRAVLPAFERAIDPPEPRNQHQTHKTTNELTLC